jgi:hypothetical protein
METTSWPSSISLWPQPGIWPWKGWALDQQRVWCTWRPVAKAARAGTQTGEGV